MKTLRPEEFDRIMARASEAVAEPFPELDLLAGLPSIDEVIAAPATSDARARMPSALPKRSEKISIRVPGRTLAAFRAQAAASGVGYQTLVNRVLRAAAAGWGHL